MEITEVKVFPIGEEKLKAFVSVVFDRCFMVNDIKIIQGRDGLFISMPSRKKKNGEFKDVAHPLNNQTRRLIEGEILGEYERVLEQRGEPLPAPQRTHGPAPAERASSSSASSGPAPPAPGSTEREPMPAVAAAATPDDGPAADVPPPDPVAVPASAPAAAVAAVAADAGGADGKPAEAAPEPQRGDEEDDERPSLEEVQEIHLRDSFWSVS